MGQALAECGKTVGKRLLTVFPALLLAVAWIGPARSDVVMSTGLSGGEEMHPFATMNFKQAWRFSTWNFSVLADGRGQFDDGVGDAQAKAELHGDTFIAPLTLFELDAAYGFDRERSEAIKQFHLFRGDAGIAHEFEDFKIKADVGAETQLFENTTQKGFSSLDRSDENLVESEAAVRLTLFHEATIQPFVEAAFVERDYFKRPDRGFSGPELIGGFTFAYPKLTGDLAVMYASRDVRDGGGLDVIGPYVDLKWLVRSGSEISLGLGAGIEQDTSGLADLYPYYSGRFEALQNLTPALILSFAVEAVVERRNTGTETEITPTITLAWTGNNGLGVFGSAGLTYTKIETLKATVEPDFEIGMKWAF